MLLAIIEGRWDNIGGEEYMKAQFQKLKTRFVEQNIPVLIGEFAAIRRQLSDEKAQRGHDLSRAAFDRCVVRRRVLMDWFHSIGIVGTVF